MLTAPVPTAVTSPLADTVATLGDDVSQTTERPASGLPMSPRAMVVSRIVSVTTSEKTPGITATVSTIEDGPATSSASHDRTTNAKTRYAETPRIVTSLTWRRTADDESSASSLRRFDDG